MVCITKNILLPQCFIQALLFSSNGAFNFMKMNCCSHIIALLDFIDRLRFADQTRIHFLENTTIGQQ